MTGPDLDAAVSAALALTPATRLVAVGAHDLIATDDLAVFAAFMPAAAPGPRVLVADPARLPLVEAIADRALVQLGGLATPPAVVLRELWRVLAPAGWLVVVDPLPPFHRLGHALVTRLHRRRITEIVTTGHLFEVRAVTVTRTALVIRADKCDGLGVVPPHATGLRAGARQAARVRTNTA